ncbi:class I SAM-dependent methyltransferase [Halorubrum halodurans]|uniref:class I SAM-dependent methyltransferase n=1 Tax=Halorubrum halodurans TaxID=1383851 RepID=UPI000B9873AE
MVAEDAARGSERVVTGPEHVDRVRERYDRWARVYDWFARATAGVGGVRDACVDALDVDEGDTVVEFGCGPGPNLPALREAVGPSGHVVGVDLTGRMLDRAQVLIARRGWRNVSLVRGDAATPAVADADAVLSTFVTSLFPDPAAVVGEWCELADRVVVAGFAPRGNRAANAALWAFTRLSTSLFDATGEDPLGQLDRRTAAARHELDARMDRVEGGTFAFGTIVVSAGYRETAVR